MAYYGGYSSGYSKAQEEYRKKEYEAELKRAKEVYQGQTGLPWTEAEEDEFAHLWRLKLIKAPETFRSMKPTDRLLLIAIHILPVFFCISGLVGLITNGDVKFSVLFFLGGGAVSITFFYDSCKRLCALQTIQRIGEEAWRKQLAIRQKEDGIEPWNAEGNY